MVIEMNSGIGFQTEHVFLSGCLCNLPMVRIHLQWLYILCKYALFDTQWPICFCAGVSLNIHSSAVAALRGFPKFWRYISPPIHPPNILFWSGNIILPPPPPPPTHPNFFLIIIINK